MFELPARLPIDHTLKVTVMDWDRFSADDIIGETKIDLENRFLSQYRATCGLQETMARSVEQQERERERWCTYVCVIGCVCVCICLLIIPVSCPGKVLTSGMWVLCHWKSLRSGSRVRISLSPSGHRITGRSPLMETHTH